MGLGYNPLINDLIQHTFKINFLFVEKFTVIHLGLDKKNPVDHKLLCISEDLAPRLIQSISRNIRNRKKSFETIV